MASIINGELIDPAGISEGTITFNFNLQGFKKEELKVEYVERRRGGPNKVRIRGESPIVDEGNNVKWRMFAKEISISQDWDPADIHALFQINGGILTLKLVKKKTSTSSEITGIPSTSSSSSSSPDERVTEIKILETEEVYDETKNSYQQIVYDVVHEADADTLIVALPSGLKKEQIKLQLLRKGTLRILILFSDFKWITQQKEFPLPPDCDENDIKSKLDGDILYVIFPKKHDNDTNSRVEHDNETNSRVESPQASVGNEAEKLPKPAKRAAAAASGDDERKTTTKGRENNNEEGKLNTEVVKGGGGDDFEARKLKLRRQPMKLLNVAAAAAAVVALVVVAGVVMYAKTMI